MPPPHLNLPHLKLIGPPVWMHAGGELRFVAERPFQLLALLAHHGDWLPRERLAAMFWPDHAADAARRNLRKVLYRLRELPELPVPDDEGGALRWRVATDLQQLDQAIAAGRTEPVAEAYAHQPFEGLDGDATLADWLAFERQRLRRRWREVLLAGAARCDDGDAALRWLAALRDADPLDEEALRLQLQWLVRGGQLPRARDEYARFERLLAVELSARPQAETRRLAAGLDAGGAAARAPATATSAATAETGFIGRGAERREAMQWLADPAQRWLTIAGPGGIGKTRFAQAQLPAFAAAFAGEVVFVPLDDLTDAAQLPPRLAQALSLGASARSPAGLQHALASRALLLVLDNLEQIPGGAAVLQPLLDGAPGVRVVATSRERCQARGEWLLAMAGLPCPDPEDCARAEEFDAVRLFAQAARLHQPRFDVAAERAATVALVAAVEGWPLAIELAAAWTRHLGVAEIAAGLGDAGAGELLAAPAGVAAGSRQSDLGAVLDQSWRRLVEAEREALMRLAILDAPFRTEVGLAVAGAPLPLGTTRAPLALGTTSAPLALGTTSAPLAHGTTSAPLALLASLADKSLLRRDRGGSDARWSLHALVQRHARGHAARRDGLARQAEEALAEWMAQRAARCPPRRAGRAYTQALAELEPDFAALRQAWTLSLAHGRGGRLAMLLRPLARLLMERNEWAAGRALLEPALPVIEDFARGPLQAALAQFALYGGDLRGAMALAREALRRLRRGGDGDALMQCLWVLSLGATREGRQALARRCLDEGLALARRLGDQSSEANFLDGLSTVAYSLGRFAEQIELLERSIDLAERSGGRPMVSLSNLANAFIAVGRGDQARAAFERGLRLAAGARYRRERATLLLNFGLFLFDRGEVERAEHCALEGLQAAGDGVDPMFEMHLLGLQAAIELRRGESAAAEARLRRGLASARRFGLVQTQLWLLLEWARWLHAAGRTGEAARVVGAVAAHPALPSEEARRARDFRALLGIDGDPRLLAAEGEGRTLSPEAVIDALAAG